MIERIFNKFWRISRIIMIPTKLAVARFRILFWVAKFALGFDEAIGRQGNTRSVNSSPLLALRNS